MDWPEYISLKLNLQDGATKLIIDSTGLLSSEPFARYLADRQYDFIITEALSEILTFLSTPGRKVIITSLPAASLPSSISRDAEIIRFGFDDIPFHLPAQFYQSASPEDVVNTLSYISGKNVAPNRYQKISVSELLSEARNYARQREIQEITRQIEALLDREHHYDVILDLGRWWGKLTYLLSRIPEAPDARLMARIDQYVSDYLLAGNYRSVFYEPVRNMKSVDKIPQYLKSGTAGRIALLCFDGMGMAEWWVLKEYLAPLGLRFAETCTFAMIPSNTLISRSAIYLGDPDKVYQLPYNQDEKSFKAHFRDRHTRFFSHNAHITPESLLGIEVVSVIFTAFDEHGHQAILPGRGHDKSIYLDTVRKYLERSTIGESIVSLVETGFTVFICSDHGNVIAQGNGQKIDKWLQDQYCKRAAIVKNDDLSRNLPHLDCHRLEVPFDPERLILLAKDRQMFDSQTSIAITHGGITVDEIVVPFIEVCE